MKNWWTGLQVRERIILVAAGLISLFILLDSLVFEEIRLTLLQRDEQIEQAKEDLDWMIQAAGRLPAKSNSSRKIKSGRVVTFVDQQVRRQGLKKNMQQMTPVEGHSARLRLSDVDFNQLLKFFNAIDGSLIIEEVRLLPSGESGLVNVSLVLTNGAKAG